MITVTVVPLTVLEMCVGWGKTELNCKEAQLSSTTRDMGAPTRRT